MASEENAVTAAAKRTGRPQPPENFTDALGKQP